jgi:archaeosine-15-forming tRNA-guanine transglycosylase
MESIRISDCQWLQSAFSTLLNFHRILLITTDSINIFYKKSLKTFHKYLLKIKKRFRINEDFVVVDKQSNTLVKRNEHRYLIIKYNHH